MGRRRLCSAVLKGADFEGLAVLWDQGMGEGYLSIASMEKTRTPFFCEQLPRHEIGVVLQHRQNHLIALLKIGAPPRLSALRRFGMGGE
eukprot:scaffold237347_cov31-Tisochrysis_lutea.AAC.2